MMYHVTPLKNLESIKKHGLLCKIGLRSQKIGEPVSAIYLFPDLGYANDAIANWLGDEFDNERASIADIPAKLIDFDHIIYCQ